jgi:hypothetical protein
LSAPQPLASAAQYPYRDPSVPNRTLRDEESTAENTLPMPQETTSSRGPTVSPASHGSQPRMSGVDRQRATSHQSRIRSRPCDAALQSRTAGNGNRGWRFIKFALATLAASPVIARLADTDTHIVPTAIATGTAVAWHLLRRMRRRSARGSESVQRTAADVHVTRCAVDVASLERATHTHVIRVACTTATWRSQLASALCEATGEGSMKRATARLHALRSAPHWSWLLVAGIVPPMGAFVAYAAAELVQVGAVFTSLSVVSGITPSELVARWLSKRPSIVDAVRRATRNLDLRLDGWLRQAFLTTSAPATYDPVQLGVNAACEGWLLSALLSSTASRLGVGPTVCEVAAWSAWTDRPVGVVLLIEWRATLDEPANDAKREFDSCVQFLIEHVPLAALVVHDNMPEHSAHAGLLTAVKRHYERLPALNEQDFARIVFAEDIVPADCTTQERKSALAQAVLRRRAAASGHLVLIIGEPAGLVGRFLARHQLGCDDDGVVVFIDFSVLPSSTTSPGDRAFDEREALRVACAEGLDEAALNELIRVGQITWVFHRLDSLTPVAVTNPRVVAFILRMLRGAPRGNDRDKVVLTLRDYVDGRPPHGRADSTATITSAVAEACHPETEHHAATIIEVSAESAWSPLPDAGHVPAEAEFAFVPCNPLYTTVFRPTDGPTVYGITVSSQDASLRLTASSDRLHVVYDQLSETQRFIVRAVGAEGGATRWTISSFFEHPLVYDENSRTIHVGVPWQEAAVFNIMPAVDGDGFHLSVCLADGEASISCRGLGEQLRVGYAHTKFHFVAAAELVHCPPRVGVAYEIIPRVWPSARLAVLETDSGRRQLQFSHRATSPRNSIGFVVRDVQLPHTLDASWWEIEATATSDILTCDATSSGGCALSARAPMRQRNPYQQFSIQLSADGTYVSIGCSGSAELLTARYARPQMRGLHELRGPSSARRSQSLSTGGTQTDSRTARSASRRRLLSPSDDS